MEPPPSGLKLCVASGDPWEVGGFSKRLPVVLLKGGL